MTDIARAVKLLEAGDCTCVLCRGESVVTSSLSGVAPMVKFLDESTDLRGYSAADKIVGRAAAMLFILAGVRELYAAVMSEGALELLERFGVAFSYGALTREIISRDGLGRCPMEEAVRGIDNPAHGFAAIKEKMRRLRGGGQ